jgi:serine/threonine protein kinase/CheY-like chemotaxis protein/Tfp pilus assembly protein PilF
MKKILVIEDDLALLETLKSFLETENFEVITAADGEKGLEEASKEIVDLIVLDLGLPRIDGFEVCRRLRAQGNMTPVIMLSGEKKDELDKATGLDVGADDYVVKPFGIKEFLSRINAVLRRTKPKVEERGRHYALTRTLEIIPKTLRKGSTIAGRYEVLEELGRGGMGRVFRVADKKIGEEVALKVLNPAVAADKKTIERFRNELKIARKIAQRNVCRMFDLTMEYVPGEDLKSLLIKTGQLTVEKTISIARQVCEGLAEAHRIGVVHRDLKPQNIMIDKEENSRIMDFGIARSLRMKGITEAGTIVGTPEYMSPEQVEGQETDQRSDIYSLGVILYEMIAGKVPFEGDSTLDVALMHKTESPRDPREINPHISEGMSRLILNCLEKDKEKRYQNVDSILSDLAKVEKGVPVVERYKEKKRPEAKVRKEVRWKESVAVLPFVDLSPEKDQEYFCDGMTEDIINKLSRFEELKVISRTSVMRYKKTDKDIREIGHELNVATVLEGSIRKEKDNIRVSAELVNVEDGFQLWADTYDRKLESVFEVQDEVSHAIAEALKVKLSPKAIESLKEGRPANIEVYEYTLKGMHLINNKYVISCKEDDFKAAVKMFNKAIECDPNYALTYTGLTWAYQHHYQITGKRKDLRSVIASGETAFRMDPNLVETNAAIGWVHLLRGDYDSAYLNYKRALEISPHTPGLSHIVGLFYRRLGLLCLAVDYATRNIELDPFFLPSHSLLAHSLIYSGQFKKAEAGIKSALEVDPGNFWSFHDYSLLFMMGKDIEKAEEYLNKAEKVNPGYPGIQVYKSLMLALRGDKKHALALRKNGVIYALLGMREEAITYIQDVIKKGNEHFQYSYLPLEHSTFYDSLRDEPRFAEIIEKQKKKYEERLQKYGKF